MAPMIPSLQPYQRQLTTLKGRLQNPTYESRIPTIQNRINSIRTNAGVKPRDWTNWQPQYKQTQAPAPTAANPVQDYWSGLQPESVQTTPAAEPTDYTASPAFQWQLKQGQEALNQQLSARGLYDSGAALQANQDMQQQLMSNEVNRQQEVQQWKKQVEMANADRAQANTIGNANRLWDIVNSEQARKDVLGQNQFANRLALLNWFGDQNPMQYVSPAITNSAELQSELAKYASGYMSQMYPQLFQYLQNVIPPFYATGSTGSTNG